VGAFEIAGKAVERGSREIVTVYLTKDLGFDINIKAHVLAGKKEGPTLLILSMLHGEEWFSALIVGELIKRVNLDALKGNIVAIPVANPSAFNTGTRCIMDNSDEPDANRSFGGRYEWISNQLTTMIEKEFISRADFMMDYHIGSWGSTMADIGYIEDPADEEVTKISRGMALAYQFPIIHNMMSQKNKGTRSASRRARFLYRIPTIVPELGGLGFGEAIEKQWLEQNINGIMGNLKYLNMLDGNPDYCDQYLITNDYWRVSPRNGGYLETNVALDRQGTSVRKGELLAKIIDPETFEILEELESPGDGILFYTCRSYMVRPGGWAFGIAKMEIGSSSKWVRKDDLLIEGKVMCNGSD
jgi:uncharacterized protein